MPDSHSNSVASDQNGRRGVFDTDRRIKHFLLYARQKQAPTCKVLSEILRVHFNSVVSGPGHNVGSQPDEATVRIRNEIQL